MTARHGCGQGLLRCNGTYRGDGNGYPLLFCCATGHQVCYVWHPQSPSLSEEAFAGSINGDCEYLQMQGHFRRISAPCMLKIRHYGFLSNPQKKIRLKLARRLTRTKVPMPSDGKLSARELMLRVTIIIPSSATPTVSHFPCPVSVSALSQLTIISMTSTMYGPDCAAHPATWQTFAPPPFSKWW